MTLKKQLLTSIKTSIKSILNDRPTITHLKKSFRIYTITFSTTVPTLKVNIGNLRIIIFCLQLEYAV